MKDQRHDKWFSFEILSEDLKLLFLVFFFNFLLPLLYDKIVLHVREGSLIAEQLQTILSSVIDKKTTAAELFGISS